VTEPLTIRVRDWTTLPGARYRMEGPGSAQEFRDDILRPALKTAVSTGRKLRVDLDGCAGFAASFLNEVFGALTRFEAMHVDIHYAEDPDTEHFARSQLYPYDESEPS
jgi:STAS-like domain of unknown function (DUF4325)